MLKTQQRAHLFENMDRESQERGRSQPTSERQMIHLGKNDDEFKKMRRGMEQIFRQSSESLFFQHLKVKQTRSQDAKEQQASELQYASDSQQDLFYLEWKYKKTLKSLKCELANKNIGAVLQDSYQQMFYCFKSYRSHLLKNQEASIVARKMEKLSSISKQREPQRTKLQEELKKTQQENDKTQEQFSQSIKIFEAAIERKDPFRSRFGELMKEKLQNHIFCEKKVDKLECALRQFDDEAKRKIEEINHTFGQQWEKRRSELIDLLDKQTQDHEKIKRDINRKVKEELNSILEQLQQQVISLEPQLRKSWQDSENALFSNVPDEVIRNLRRAWKEKRSKMLQLRQKIEKLKVRLHQYQ